MVCPSPAAPTCAPYSRPVITTACWAQQWPNRIWGSALSGLKTSLENSAVAVAPLSFYSQWGALQLHSRGPHTPLASGCPWGHGGSCHNPSKLPDHRGHHQSHTWVPEMGLVGGGVVSERLGLLLTLPGNQSSLHPGSWNLKRHLFARFTPFIVSFPSRRKTTWGGILLPVLGGGVPPALVAVLCVLAW